MSDIKLLHGDCYELIKQIPDKSIDLIYTDIPYLYEDGGCSNSALSDRIAKVHKKEIENITHSIDYSIFDEWCRVLKHIYVMVWCSKEQMLDIMNYFVKEKKCRFNMLVWCKTNPTPMTNNVWLPDVEYCICFKEPGAPRYNDGYKLKSKYYVSAKNVKDKKEFGHPTIKPLELVQRHILHCSNEGDVVLDPFMGSGTTGVACLNTGRNFIGMEIDDNYFESAEKRIKDVEKYNKQKLF